MDAVNHAMHLAVGQEYGRESTCVGKIDYESEETAAYSAVVMSRKYGRRLESYPCFWCGGWHIGRAMSEEEISRFRPDRCDVSGRWHVSPHKGCILR